MNPLKKLADAYKNWQYRRTKPLHIEFNVTDACNLNCRGCTHYSALVPKDQAESFDVLERSMRHLGRVASDGIEEVYLIGGETLLYPRLADAMRLAAECFPKSRIRIFTNGLLLPRMSEEFWEACRETHTIIDITRYPIKFDYETAERLCRDKGVEISLFADRNEGQDVFFKFPLDPEKGQNGRRAHFRCFNFGCLAVQGDKLFPCSVSSCVGYLNKRFGTDFRHEEGDYLRVEDIKSAKDILRFRARPVPFCGYCCHCEEVPYARSKQEKEEWVKV